ncbi:serine hydrolase domain-containing protein [Amycolatopsis sp. NPDC021455]|uniref:serine hydrolase domain-containing protein n=1 Tax=Amycolatopsis sp. NPDC021455 TaxID=3154901 RepID=UPI0033C169B6
MRLINSLAAALLAVPVTTGATPATLPPLDPAAVAAAVRQAPGGPVLGILATVDGRDGALRVTAGRADVRTDRPVRADGRFRIASITKTFVATTVLQLVAEHRLGLDDPVQRFLPGVLPASYPPIPVRELLQHTSGLYDYGQEIMTTPAQVLRDRWRHRSPRELVDIATAHPLAFPPGTRLAYSNTGYVLLGMVIRAVTAHWWGDEVRTRLLAPLHLTGTTVPGDDPAIPGPHAHGYVVNGDRPELVDLTTYNPSWADAAGDMISSARDLHTFFAALLAGRLLPAALLDQMLTPYPNGTLGGLAGYGLGIMTLRLPPACGGQTLYGHGAGIVGFAGLAFSTRDGQRSFVVSVNTTAFDAEQSPISTLLSINQTVFCG